MAFYPGEAGLNTNCVLLTPVFVDKLDIIIRRYKPTHGASKPFALYLFAESEAIRLYFLYQDSAEPVRMWDLRAQKCLQKELTILRKASC